MCMFGMVGQRGQPLRKLVRWIATHEFFVEDLGKKCDGMHSHEAVEGRNTSASAMYPPDLADCIVRSYLRVVQQEDFGTVYNWDVMAVRHVHFVDADKNVDAWTPLIAEAEEILARRVQKDCFLDTTSDLYRKIMLLVPWQILNIQIAALPKAKRVRPGLEACHRCSVLMQSVDRIVIETEHFRRARPLVNVSSHQCARAFSCTVTRRGCRKILHPRPRTPGSTPWRTRTAPWKTRHTS